MYDQWDIGVDHRGVPQLSENVPQGGGRVGVGTVLWLFFGIPLTGLVALFFLLGGSCSPRHATVPAASPTARVTAAAGAADERDAPASRECAEAIAERIADDGGEFAWWQDPVRTASDGGGWNDQGSVYYGVGGELRARAYTCDTDADGALTRAAWLGEAATPPR